jgi:hypothetical protein
MFLFHIPIFDANLIMYLNTVFTFQRPTCAFCSYNKLRIQWASLTLNLFIYLFIFFFVKNSFLSK